jgi:hypothetical protein
VNRLFFACLIAVALWPAEAGAQTNCVEGGTYIDGQGRVMYCTGIGTAVAMAKLADASGVPAGLIALSLTSCPTGWAEATALNGVMLRGTLAANGNVGTTGGSDTITPQGTISQPALSMNSFTPAGSISTPTFTGSALATHAHELPFQIPSTTTTRQLAAATFGTGTSRAATAVSATGTGNTTSAAVALSQAVSAGTPTGTISTPSFTGQSATLTGSVTAPTFTGTAFNNRPAYVNVIFCAKQ